MPSAHGCALFIGNDAKVFVIHIETQMGQTIANFMREEPKERPYTHDLMVNLLKGLGATIERVIITHVKNSTYYARLIVQQQNELGRKIVELDARPSDCLALATALKRPIFITQALFSQVEDMSEYLQRHTQAADEAGNEPE